MTPRWKVLTETNEQVFSGSAEAGPSRPHDVAAALEPKPSLICGLGKEKWLSH